jgi:hypothetical protein
MRRIGFSLLILLLLSSIGVVAAQTGGQFCVRAYEDRNGNAQFDLNEREPFITRGLNADLLNAENIVVASALMDTAPTAAQGVICFQFLEAGQYSIVVTSADYAPTTPDTFTASISDGTLPTVVEYGAQRIAASEAVTNTSNKPASILDQRDTLQRIVLSALGALLVVAGMTVLGVLIYLVAFRRAAASTSDYYPKPPTTGSTPSVKLIDTAELEKK